VTPDRLRVGTREAGRSDLAEHLLLLRVAGALFDRLRSTATFGLASAMEEVTHERAGDTEAEEAPAAANPHA
jgi:hypothetical protein